MKVQQLLEAAASPSTDIRKIINPLVKDMDPYHGRVSIETMHTVSGMLSIKIKISNPWYSNRAVERKIETMAAMHANPSAQLKIRNKLSSPGPGGIVYASKEGRRKMLKKIYDGLKGLATPPTRIGLQLDNQNKFIFMPFKDANFEDVNLGGYETQMRLEFDGEYKTTFSTPVKPAKPLKWVTWDNI